MDIFLDTLKWSVITGAAALGLRLLRPVFEKRYSARWRYWLWLALAVLALLAPVQWEKLAPAAPAVHTPVVIGVPEMEVQVIRGDRVSVAVRPVTGLPPAAGPSGTAQIWRTAEVLPLIWLGGAAVFALYTVLGTLLFRHKARRWSRKPDGTALRVYESVWRDMGLKKAPPLSVSGAANSPMLTGLLRPRLLLPGENWSEQELSFILRHELTHYKRHDLWYKLVLLAANALHWFNPLMYLLVREASVDMELTCDDDVVFGESREVRRAYSETLLTAVRRNKGLGTSLSTNFYGGKEVMKARFRNILGRQSRKWGALVLALTLLATVVSACAVGLRQEEQETGKLSGTDISAPEIPSGGPGLTAGPSEYADAVRYQDGELGMILPSEYAGVLLVNPDSHPGYDRNGELFAVFHKDTYLNEDPSLYDGHVMSITRYTREEFYQGWNYIVMEYGYPFATDSEGRIYCITREHDITVPPEKMELLEPLVTYESFRGTTDDFTQYNNLEPFDPVVGQLTAEELAAFEDYFNNDRLRNGMLRFPYNNITEVKPYFQELFYDAGEPVTDAEERRAASELFEEGLETDCVKLSTEDILNSLRTCFEPGFAVSRDWFEREWGPDMVSLWGKYLPEYDAYYTQHGDTNMVRYTFTGGERNFNDSVTLYYTADIYVRNGSELEMEWNQPMQILLRPYGDHWAAVSNVKAG